MKQLFAFLTALSLFFAFPFYVFAEQNSVDTIFYDDNIDVVTPDSFNQLFIEETTTNAASHHSTEELDPNTIYFSYSFVEAPAPDVTYADVELTMQLTVDSNQYSFLLNGTVYPYTLQSGDILWEGMLEGTSIINNNDCILLASFIRLNDNTDVQVSLTIHVLNEEPDQSIIAFSFGSNILTNQIYSELQSSMTVSHDHVSIVNDANTINSVSSNLFTEIDSHPVYWQNGNSYKLSHTHNVYFSPLTSELAISIGTYCGNINTIYENDDNISVTYVSSFEIRLKSEATSDPYTIANIGGIYDPEHEFANTSSVYTTIGNFFLDALNYLGFPVSSTILTAIFGTLENAAKGTVSSSDNYKNAYFRVSFGLGDNHSFDELPNGIPVIFLLVKNAAGYTGNSRLTSHTSIIYRTSVLDANTLQSQIYYTTSPSTTRTHIITLL